MSRSSTCLIIFLFTVLSAFRAAAARMLAYTVDPKKQSIVFCWKDPQGQPYGNFVRLQAQLALEHRRLVFAMNGGMYTETQAPLGLYIENGKQLRALNRTVNGYGNFYMQPNGVFYLDKDGRAFVSATGELKQLKGIQYATQSGPMLVINRQINPAFRQGSQNLNLRNGVGILPDGKILFVLSEEAVNFYDFALYFQQAGCVNALYLDGFVSRAWLPAADWRQTDGQFGVIIAEVANAE